MDAALQGESFYDAPTHNYIAFIQQGNIYVAHSLTAVPRQLEIDRLIGPGTDAAITFRTEYIAGPNRTTLHRTAGKPQIFHVTNNTLYYRDGIDGSPVAIVPRATCVSAVYGWIDILYGIEDQGLVVVYSDANILYSMNLKEGIWSTPIKLHEATSDIKSLKIQRTHDYRLSITVRTVEEQYMLLTSRANIMRATQDTDSLKVGISTSITSFSVKQPKIVTAKCNDNYTITIELDAPVVVIPQETSHTVNMYLYGRGYTNLYCITACEQLTDTTIRIKTDMTLGVLKDDATLCILSSKYLCTPGDTLVDTLHVPCDTSRVTTADNKDILLFNIYNIL